MFWEYFSDCSRRECLLSLVASVWHKRAGLENSLEAPAHSNRNKSLNELSTNPKLLFSAPNSFFMPQTVQFAILWAKWNNILYNLFIFFCGIKNFLFSESILRFLTSFRVFGYWRRFVFSFFSRNKQQNECERGQHEMPIAPVFSCTLSGLICQSKTSFPAIKIVQFLSLFNAYFESFFSGYVRHFYFTFVTFLFSEFLYNFSSPWSVVASNLHPHLWDTFMHQWKFIVFF